MKRQLLGFAVAAMAIVVTAPAGADVISEMAMVTGGGAASLPFMLQCVPYARTVSGVQIYGDAWTWWQQAEGKYARGYRPKVGAVMAFKPYGKMELGHVAAVSRIVDSRTVLVRHANWSLINGTRGQIENDVRAMDVSPDNDWSQVRVWFAPLQGLGGTAWPLQGFIYNRKPGRREKLDRHTFKLQPKLDIGEVPLAKLGKSASRKAAPYGLKADPYANDPIGAIIAASLK